MRWKRGVTPGGPLVFQAGYHPCKRSFKIHPKHVFYRCEIDPKHAFLHAFFLICPSCPFQNLSIWPKTHLFSNFARFWTPKRCTRVHCLVLKNNPNYVNFFTRMISNFKYKSPPPRGVTLSVDENAVVLHWWKLFTNYKNTSYLFTVQYLIMMHARLVIAGNQHNPEKLGRITVHSHGGQWRGLQCLEGTR